VSYHLSFFSGAARPSAFLCVGALSVLGRFLEAGGPADALGVRGRALGRLCATIGLLIGLWLLCLAQPLQGCTYEAAYNTLAPNAEKPAAAEAGRARRGIV
jgi:hypothetical protein